MKPRDEASRIAWKFAPPGDEDRCARAIRRAVKKAVEAKVEEIADYFDGCTQVYCRAGKHGPDCGVSVAAVIRVRGGRK